MRMMRTIAPIKFVLATAALFCVCSKPSLAICEVPQIVSSVFPEGGYSYILTPGLDPGSSGSSVGDSLDGRFWAIAAGDPAVGRGNDSGGFQATGIDGWIQRPSGYPATFHGTWAMDGRIDGCAKDAGAETCVAVILSDQSQGKGYFAYLTAAPTDGDYSFVQPENAAITLAPIPEPSLTGTLVMPSFVTTTARVATPDIGVYAESACPQAHPTGVRLYSKSVQANAPRPSELRRQEGEWTLMTGGESVTGQPLTFGDDHSVTVSCVPGNDVYVASTLVFDSGFETKHVARPSNPIRCGVGN